MNFRRARGYNALPTGEGIPPGLAAESRCLLRVPDQRLAECAWIMGDAYSIADIAIFPWVRNLIGFYQAGELMGIADFPHVTRAGDWRNFLRVPRS